jgi:hypothetical protein
MWRWFYSIFSLLGLFSMLPNSTFGQLYPIVGIEVKPIIPSELFSNATFKSEAGQVKFAISPQLGYNFGMVLRKAVYKGISIETGITYTLRKYNASASDSSGFSAAGSFRYISYEIPILALFYIHTGPMDYIDGAFGFSADFFASDVKNFNDNISIFTARKYWVLPALQAAIGYERRTKSSGYFYFGGSYHRMLTTMAYTKIEFANQAKMQSIILPLTGHYFALDFKYFFLVTDKNINPDEQNDY